MSMSFQNWKTKGPPFGVGAEPTPEIKMGLSSETDLMPRGRKPSATVAAGAEHAGLAVKKTAR